MHINSLTKSQRLVYLLVSACLVASLVGRNYFEAACIGSALAFSLYFNWLWWRRHANTVQNWKSPDLSQIDIAVSYPDGNTLTTSIRCLDVPAVMREQFAQMGDYASRNQRLRLQVHAGTYCGIYGDSDDADPWPAWLLDQEPAT